MGWDMDDFLSGKYDSNGPNSPEKAASLIQAWLYFSLLHMITGAPVETQDYVRKTKDERKVITTARLPHLLNQWRQVVAAKSKVERSQYSEQLDARFTALGPYLDLLCNNDCLSQEVRYSMAILRSTLNQTKLAMFPSSAKPDERWLGDFAEKTRSRLQANGWCKSDTSRIFQRFSILTLYYASTLNTRYPIRDHSKCSEFGECRAKSLNLTANGPVHAKTNCTCSFIEIPKERLLDIIDRDHIPLLSFQAPGQLELVSFDVADVSNSPSYVAISHI